jgi:hypothetical protein
MPKRNNTRARRNIFCGEVKAFPAVRIPRIKTTERGRESARMPREKLMSNVKDLTPVLFSLPVTAEIWAKGQKLQALKPNAI